MAEILLEVLLVASEDMRSVLEQLLLQKLDI